MVTAPATALTVIVELPAGVVPCVAIVSVVVQFRAHEVGENLAVALAGRPVAENFVSREVDDTRVAVAIFCTDCP